MIKVSLKCKKKHNAIALDSFRVFDSSNYLFSFSENTDFIFNINQSNG